MRVLDRLTSEKGRTLLSKDEKEGEEEDDRNFLFEVPEHEKEGKTLLRIMDSLLSFAMAEKKRQFYLSRFRIEAVSLAEER